MKLFRHRLWARLNLWIYLRGRACGASGRRRLPGLGAGASRTCHKGCTNCQAHRARCAYATCALRRCGL